MSVGHFIAYDYPLPKINLKKMKKFRAMNMDMEFETGFAVESSYNDSEGFIDKKYIYNVSLEADISSIGDLRRYLIENMKSDSEAEIWSIGLGGDYTKHYKNKVRIKGISPREHNMADDDMDWYKENYVVPRRKTTTIEELSMEDISFILNDLSACLIIKK